MSLHEQSKSKARAKAIELIRSKKTVTSVDDMCARLLSGDKLALASAITIVESTTKADKDKAANIINRCLPHSGRSIRVGITGIPGVGKSTFIEALGMYLISQGKRVAVLAVDPSSELSHGSILGDKTRMTHLSVHNQAFVRPSASANTLGGVARKTREAITLCEAAGFDIILIETVGVGQSETTVYHMTDFFLLLLLAGAGDQLQGIKRGIMEMCDGIVINKADGAEEQKSIRAKAEFGAALHFFAEKDNGWRPLVETCSSLEHKNIDHVWNMIESHHSWTRDRGSFQSNRKAQDLKWMREALQQMINDLLETDKSLMAEVAQAQKLIEENTLSPFEAAESIVRKLTIKTL